jgi:hypothetical protein
MFLHFPLMHPDLVPADRLSALPDGTRFLDPGLAQAGSARHHRPEDAPFDPRTARALLADTLRYGESQADPRDLLAQSLVEQAGALSPESSRAVQAEVERSVLGAAPAASDDAQAAARRQAQMLLLLAWNLEERLLDLRGVEEKLKGAWERLDQSVAAGAEVVDDEADQDALALGRELSGLRLPDASDMALPWRKLVEAFALLAPGAALCATDAGIGAALAEAGTPEGPLEAVPGAARVFRAQAWRLMGQDRMPADRPWLDAMLTLGVFAPAQVAGRE